MLIVVSAWLLMVQINVKAQKPTVTTGSATYVAPTAVTLNARLVTGSSPAILVFEHVWCLGSVL